MAARLVLLGRVAFAVLLFVQAASLASYPAKYKDNEDLYSLIVLYVPAFLLWLWVMVRDKNLNWLFAVWVCYIIGFVIFLGIVFGGNETIEDKLDKEHFFGPNILKMTLCLTPLILLLLLSTGIDSIVYRELIWMLSLRIALDLFDGVEMLEVIIEENKFSHDVPKSFEKAIFSFACISFLLSPLQLIEIKLGDSSDWKFRKCTAISRTTIQVICVNCVFLGLRLALWFAFSKEASIFIAKNVIILFLGLFEICSMRKCCGCEDEEYF